MHNFADQSGPEVFGTIRLHDALVHSVNSVFCNIGKELGAIPILRQAERFGLYSRATARDAGRTSGAPSGLYRAASSSSPGARARSTQVAWRSARSGCS